MSARVDREPWAWVAVWLNAPKIDLNQLGIARVPEGVEIGTQYRTNNLLITDARRPFGMTALTLNREEELNWLRKPL